jgi:hypothetical protein
MRAMTQDVEGSIVLPNDVRNPKTYSLAFFGKLVGALVAMRFRKPTISIAEEALIV